MTKPSDRPLHTSRAQPRDMKTAPGKSKAVLLILGVALVIGLVAMERPDWLTLRPASTGAVAIFHASDQHQPNEAQQANSALRK